MKIKKRTFEDTINQKESKSIENAKNDVQQENKKQKLEVQKKIVNIRKGPKNIYVIEEEHTTKEKQKDCKCDHCEKKTTNWYRCEYVSINEDDTKERCETVYCEDCVDQHEDIMRECCICKKRICEECADMIECPSCSQYFCESHIDTSLNGQCENDDCEFNQYDDWCNKCRNGEKKEIVTCQSCEFDMCNECHVNCVDCETEGCKYCFYGIGQDGKQVEDKSDAVVWKCEGCISDKNDSEDEDDEVEVDEEEVDEQEEDNEDEK